MRYYLQTKTGPITNDYGDIIKFNSYSDARHFAIDHCDLSDPRLEIKDGYESWTKVEV